MKLRLVYALCFIMAISVSAQSLAIGPQLGFVKSPDADKSSILPALAARINILNITVEGSIGYKQEEFANGDVKQKSFPILVTGMISLIPLIHAEAGIGWYNIKSDYSGQFASIASQTTSKVGYHFGAGAELPLGNMLLTGDIRYVYMDLNVNPFSIVTNLKSDYYVIAVGLLFKL